MGQSFQNCGSFIAIFEKFLIVIIFKIAEICSKLPFSKIYLATPDFWMLIVYYVLITSVIYLFFMKKIKFIKFILGDGIKMFFVKYWKNLISIMIVITMVLNIIKIIPKNLKIYFVDVGQRRLLYYKKSNGQKYYY